MNKFAVYLFVSAMLWSATVIADPLPNAQDAQLTALVKELQAQNAKLAENQAAIDAKLVTLAEAVRLARIFASRGGR